MDNAKLLNYIEQLLANLPSDWLNLTTHRLDIYNESQAKVEFLDQLEALYNSNVFKQEALAALPTAYDYIRLGHPLSSVLEWALARINGLEAAQVISFSSITIPIYAVLRRNLLLQKNTRVVYTDDLPSLFDAEVLRTIYGYTFELQQISDLATLDAFDGSTIYLDQSNTIGQVDLPESIDFHIGLYKTLGSILMVHGEANEAYVSEIQHVRRRETIAMTPANALVALQKLVDSNAIVPAHPNRATHKAEVVAAIQEITDTQTKPSVASSGLSMQYAIMMGLVHDAVEHHPGKAIKFVVPPNCYGGTNDQARRVAAAISNVEVVDLPVDAGSDMVESVNQVLTQIAKEDAIPYIIAEIPTNPRVEVPDLQKLQAALSGERFTNAGNKAIAPVFILDQTFCPNVHFLGGNAILGSVKALAYVSGSKFPSGGKCTAGYCVGNAHTAALLEKIEQHLLLCHNEATSLQYEILAAQLPSMNARIAAAYANTRDFVNFIQEQLPTAKINFVSEALAAEGFTPSVFSLDLPTKGATAEEKEQYKRALNHQLIQRMIGEIPNESKYCVSYGQLKGCYWTIPATSTQGTTKEGDKDYIARVALSPEMDLDLHKKVFLDFVKATK